MSNIFLDRYAELGQKIVPEDIQIPKVIRINTLKMDVQSILRRLNHEGVKLTKVPFLDFGYFWETTKFSPGSTPEHLLGYYYLQEAAAQIPVQVLQPKKEELILDMSAAPGGKTTQIAQYMQNEGIIVALDNNSMRLLTLRNNLERIGIKNTIIYQKDAKFVSDLGVKFDKILLDAPCSGNFCIDPNWLEKRKIENFKDMSKEQKKLLAAAYEVLKPNGILVYSTCSLEPEENEFVIDWFLKEYPEMRLEKIDISTGDEGLTEAFGNKLNPSIKLTKRFWPNKTKTQGFFIAKLRKEQ